MGAPRGSEPGGVVSKSARQWVRLGSAKTTLTFVGTFRDAGDEGENWEGFAAQCLSQGLPAFSRSANVPECRFGPTTDRNNRESQIFETTNNRCPVNGPELREFRVSSMKSGESQSGKS